MVRSSPQSGHESFFLSIETMELLLLVPQWNYSMGQTLRWNYSTGNSQSLASNPREDKWNGRGREKVAEFPSVCETRPVLCQNMAPRVNTSIRDDCKPSFYVFYVGPRGEPRRGPICFLFTSLPCRHIHTEHDGRVRKTSTRDEECSCSPS